jgi:hypothetical protein
MRKLVGSRGPESEQVAGAQAAPPAMEPILAMVDSLSRTLNCIQTMYATEPNGPIRKQLETERANFVIGLFAARVAAMRLSSGEQASEMPGSASAPLAG